MKTQNNNIAILNNSTNANRFKTIILGAAASLLLLTSCEKNDDIDIPNNANQSAEIFGGLELENSIQSSRENDLQLFSVDATTGGLIIGEQGTTINFPPNAFEHLGGEAVSGPVDIELVEVYNRAEMLKKRLPTNGKQNNGDISTIISGGEFFINATQNGQQLVPAAAFDLTAPTNNFNPEMTVFRPENCDTLDCDVVWEEDEQAQVIGGEIQNADGSWTSAYIAPLTGFGWTNLDRWYLYAGPKTTILVDVPEGFDDTNSAVYVSYDGEPTALALLDTYDASLELFSEHYGQMPIGQQVHFIFVSVQDGDYVYAIQAATIVDGHTEVISTTQITSEAGITALINALP
jgi:hypothetical protein